MYSKTEYNNKALEAMHDIFIDYNNSQVSNQNKLDVINNILLKKQPNSTWKLLLLIVDNARLGTKLIETPYKESEDTNPNLYFYDYISEIADIMIREVDKYPNEIINGLIDKFNSLKNHQIEKLVTNLLSIDPERLLYHCRLDLVIQLRSIIGMHRESYVPECGWDSKLLDSLEYIYAHFNFEDLINKNSFLFSNEEIWIIDHKDFCNLNLKNRDTVVFKRRLEVLNRIGVSKINELIESCESPELIGKVAYFSELYDDFYKKAVKWIFESGKKGRYSNGFFSNMAIMQPRKLKKFIEKNKWDDNKLVKFLLNLPLNSTTIMFCDDLSNSAKKQYWSNLSDKTPQYESFDGLSLVARKSIDNGQLVTSVKALKYMLHIQNESIKTHGVENVEYMDAICNILSEISDKIETTEIDNHNLKPTIVNSIKIIQKSDQIDKNKKVRLEVAFSKFKIGNKIKPIFTIERMLSDSNFFAEILLEYKDYQVLRNIMKEIRLPDNTSSIELLVWVKNAQEACKSKGRLEECDFAIGKILARCKEGKDNIYPCEFARDVLEEIDSKDIVQGFISEIIFESNLKPKFPTFSSEFVYEKARKLKNDADLLRFVSHNTSKALDESSKNIKLLGDMCQARFDLYHQ
ncbi:hypothetical protein HJ090_10890 [Vibrio parahaemolyticus]|nr:hypothetical protein [Vibrio parahaemolyticus]